MSSALAQGHTGYNHMNWKSSATAYGLFIIPLILGTMLLMVDVIPPLTWLQIALIAVSFSLAIGLRKGRAGGAVKLGSLIGLICAMGLAAGLAILIKAPDIIGPGFGCNTAPRWVDAKIDPPAGYLFEERCPVNFSGRHLSECYRRRVGVLLAPTRTPTACD